MKFPPIEFPLPGRIVESGPDVTVSEDEWGVYALLEGVPPPDFSASPFEQTYGAFLGVEDRLAGLGMDFSHVARTWLYGTDILDWYPELNRARDRFFRERGVFDRYVPASTGIGWSGGEGARIVMGAFAAKAKRPGDVVFEALPSPLQCPALEYGSGFSRAAEVRTPGRRTVLVSGTASILPNSHEVAHVGDLDAQIECTMNAVRAIYESRGMTFADVKGALVYLKDASFRGAWDAWLAAHPEYPAAHSRSITADVCRPEWLFEIESHAERTLDG